MSGGGAIGALLTLLLAVMRPPALAAQTVEFRFIGVDMYGGATVPRAMDPGVSFGTRVGLATLFGRSLRAGPALDWWTADRRSSPIDVRGVSVHVDAWREFRPRAWLRPHVGLGVGLLSADAAVDPDEPATGLASATAEALDGHRFRGGVFTGATVRLTGTGALWLILEYGYTLVSRLSHHQLRTGMRLVLSDP